MTNSCFLCNTQPPFSAIFACPGCKDTWWCEPCREKVEDWHLLLCPNPVRPLTTAHRLAIACIGDLFPDDPEVNEDFYLNRARSADDRSDMFNIYKGLIGVDRTTPSTLEKWRLEGTLAENIKIAYETSPRLAKRGSYPWFMEHQDLFNPTTTSDLARSKHYCAVCEKPAMSCCSGCKKVWYCGTECQKNGWIVHIVDCNPRRPLTPADYLAADMHRNQLPESEEARALFGFNALPMGDKLILAECYQIVLNSGIKPKVLEQWRLSGMISVLRKDGSSKKCLQWLCNNTRIFGPDSAALEPDDEFEGMVDLWNKVGDRPASTVAEVCRNLIHWPEDRSKCFLLYHMQSSELGRPAPDPILKIYLSFGYCACHDEDEGFLQGIYKTLVDRCSFEEILAAYESSSLIRLMDKHELRERRFLSPYLEDVLAGSPRVFKSVWELKQFIGWQDATRHNVPLAVRLDYGFSNCRSEEEYNDLKDVYSELLRRRDANPLALHEACIQGHLFEHVSQIFPRIKKSKVRDKYRRLMRNRHPLPPPISQ